MFKSFSIGRVFDIDLRLHPSLVIAVAWVAYEFGVASSAGLAGATYGVLLLFLVLTCVVLHELGHSIMAREFGMRVRNITLYPMGGAAYIEQMPEQPRQEAAVTIAGPLVNVAIAVALLPVLLIFGIASGFNSLTDYAMAVTTLSFTGLITSVIAFNLANVAFNLLPAFPMDGGRLVRSGLTALVGREVATNIAVIFGYIVAVAMIVVGFIFTEPTLPLIGAFVIYLAYVEGKGARLQSAMRRLRVGQFALWDGGGIAPELPLKAALRGGARDVTVTSGGRVVGMLWQQDLMRAIRAGAGDLPISEVMDRRVVPVAIDEPMYNVHLAMQSTNRWAVPVVEGEHYRGIFTADRLGHVYRYLSDQLGERRFIASVSQALQGAIRSGAR